MYGNPQTSHKMLGHILPHSSLIPGIWTENPPKGHLVLKVKPVENPTASVP